MSKFLKLNCLIIILISCISLRFFSIEKASTSFDKLKISYPELYQELSKLPDITKNFDHYKIGINRISDSAMIDKNKSFYEFILNEGLKQYRKYCSPLEALLWLAQDDNIEKYISEDTNNYIFLFLNAWFYTSTSTNITSSRWSNLNEVADRLNSPSLISLYMQNRFKYDYTKGESEGIKSVDYIFKQGKGACYDHALFAGYLLKMNGYTNSFSAAVRFRNLVDNFYIGHVANIFQNPKDNQYYSMDFNYHGYDVYGPFKSIREAAEQICKNGSKNKTSLAGYRIYYFDTNKGIYLKTNLHMTPNENENME